MGFIEEIKHTDDRIRKIRETGITLFVVLSFVGVFLLAKGKNFWGCFGVAILFLTLGLYAPKYLRHFHLFWMTLAKFIGYFVSRLILSVVFFLVITPISFIARIKRHTFLDLAYPEPERRSYWLPYSKSDIKPESYEKQY